MHARWLSLLTIGILSVITFSFFYLRNQPIPLPERSPDMEPGSLEEPTVTFINPSRGARDPDVQIIEFGDFQCQSCAVIDPSIKAVLRTYPDRVSHVWKHLPNESSHPEATPSAIASVCADQQDAFWAFAERLFEQQAILSENVYTEIAKDLELNMRRFNNCVESEDALPIVLKDFEEGVALGISATPTLYIGDEVLVGQVTATEIQDAVERALKTNE